MSDIGREEFEERWAAHVGRFAMALGEIEWATDILLAAADCSFKKEASLAVRLCLLRENIGNLKPGIGTEVERVVGEADDSVIAATLCCIPGLPSTYSPMALLLRSRRLSMIDAIGTKTLTWIQCDASRPRLSN